MDDTYLTADEHMDDLLDLFKVLQKYGLKISPHKCHKCEAIQNLDSPKTLKQTRAFCGMVNFLSSSLPNLRRLLIPIYNLQKKSKKFKWTEEAERSI